MSLIPRPQLAPKTNDAAVGAFAQIMRVQVLEIERRKFGERRRTSDQNAAIRDRIAQIAPEPSVVCWNTPSATTSLFGCPYLGRMVAIGVTH
jgi:hypothetical protein